MRLNKKRPYKIIEKGGKQPPNPPPPPKMSNSEYPPAPPGSQHMTQITFCDVSSFGGHRDVIPGRTTVELVATDGQADSVSLDWTHRGEPPATGSRWTLAQVVA